MTDRLGGVIVTFEKNIREDDAEGLIKAIRMIRGVLTVKPIVAGLELHMAQMRARRDLGDKLWAVLYPEDKE